MSKYRRITYGDRCQIYALSKHKKNTEQRPARNPHKPVQYRPREYLEKDFPESRTLRLPGAE